MTQRIPILLLLGGCGGLTNDPFLEDAEFRAALPSAARARITVETAGEQGRRASLERLWMLGLTLDVSEGVNAYVQSVLGTVDEVRELRPDGRGEDWRSWGPYAIEGDQDITATMARDGATYAWRFDIDPAGGGDSVRPVFGEHLAGDSVQAGVGTMVLDFDAWAAAGFGTTAGTAEIVYDLRDGRTMRVTLRDLAEAGGEPAQDAEVWFSLQQPHQGRFEYAAKDDVNDNGVLEDLLVVTRWIPGGAGRADAEVSGGDAGGWSWRITQCWGAGAELVYEADNLGALETIGSEADCVYPEAATATHL
jgi:hypothetical protein